MPPTLPIVVAIPSSRPETADVAASPSASDARLTARPDLDVGALPALLAAFYDTIGRDLLLAPYFAALDMPAHLPRIADFWATVLFHADRYRGNAFRPHLDMPGLTAEHFAHWLATLEATVDTHHAGPGAEQMKAAAHRIAYSMQLRLGIAPCKADPSEAAPASDH